MPEPRRRRLRQTLTHGRPSFLGDSMKATPGVVLALFFSAITCLAPRGADAAPKPVNAARPRLMMTAADKARLLAKKNANDPSWVALKARADTLATYSIYPYKFATWETTPPNTINYGYDGESWLEAAQPLAFAYQMTGDTKYSNKLIELAQELIRAQHDPDNNPPNGFTPLQLNNYYPSRTASVALAFIYDYCYDQLSASLKTQMVALMNEYFNDFKVNGYQAQNFSEGADGNFFGGHLLAAAMMGYASFGDNPNAQHMIDWARIRFDGTPAATVPASETPFATRMQTFEGGQRPAAALDYLGPDITGNPFKGGFDFQAWSYGSEEYCRMIDYMLTVNSATGEDLIAAHPTWFPQILRAEKHALFPNRFLIDPTGDWGGNQGAVISRGLPARLAFVLAGAADGPGAQHFAYSEIAGSTIPDVTVFDAPEWADFYFTDLTRPSTELTLSPFYTGFGPNYPQGATSPGGTNGAIPYFIMRSDWGTTATWASVQMGSQWWDDHQHYHAGHIVLARGGDHLLIASSDWKGPAGGPGVLGGSNQALQSALANTLYFDDFGEHQRTDDRGSGGQSAVGVDHVVADELTQDFSYVRSDLSSAYNRYGDPTQEPGRRLEYFYRNFVYLRAPNVFVVFDQVKAKTSTNPLGPYKKHLRWHMPNRPTIAGRVAQLDQGQSRLFIDTVLPANANLKIVDESSNPDPCDGTDPACVPFGPDSSAETFRVEVRDPLNPLTVPFLTVLQAGSKTSTAPASTQIASLDGTMIGVEILQAGGARSIVLFNNRSGQTPAPITSTSYNLAGSSSVRHALLGVVPGARYSVTLSNGVVSVAQNAAGDRTASPSGVLYFTLPAATVLPTMTLDRTSLRFAAVTTGTAFASQTPAQIVRLAQSGAGSVTWTAASSAPWLIVSPSSGTGPASLSISLGFSGSLPASGSATGSITLTLTGAGNTVGPIAVTLNLVSSTAAASPPFGSFDTPVGDGSVLAGSVAVTGWTLDDVGVQKVEIWRDLQPGETTPPFGGNYTGDPRTGKVFIANATFVDGARPDVEGLYPTTPASYRAGWGYLMLTWGLFGQGNGTYRLYAFGLDQEGNTATIGTKSLVISNNTATKPFGSIDTPGIGGDPGTSPNFGWGLTPKVNGAATCKIPLNGVQVSIDSGPLQPVSYGDARPDIAAGFPGFSNTAAAGGHFIFDWSTLTNGPHTIGWLITDDCNRADGVGSRFFNVTTGVSALLADDAEFRLKAEATNLDPVVSAFRRKDGEDPVLLSRGYGELPVILEPDAAGSRTVEVRQGERIELRAPHEYHQAYQLGPDGQRRALPAGASWDAASGILYWQPAAGFLGRYRIVLADGTRRISIRIVVRPRDS
jgi:hypothetical protein